MRKFFRCIQNFPFELLLTISGIYNIPQDPLAVVEATSWREVRLSAKLQTLNPKLIPWEPHEPYSSPIRTGLRNFMVIL